MDISIGLDIATSISIIFAAITYISDRSRERKQNLNLYIFEQEKELLDILSDFMVNFQLKINEMGYSMGSGERNKNYILELHKMISSLLAKVRAKEAVLSSVVNEQEKKAIDLLITSIEDAVKSSPNEFPDRIQDLKKQIEDKIMEFSSIIGKRLEQ